MNHHSVKFLCINLIHLFKAIPKDGLNMPFLDLMNELKFCKPTSLLQKVYSIHSLFADEKKELQKAN